MWVHVCLQSDRSLECVSRGGAGTVLLFLIFSFPFGFLPTVFEVFDRLLLLLLLFPVSFLCSSSFVRDKSSWCCCGGSSCSSAFATCLAARCFGAVRAVAVASFAFVVEGGGVWCTGGRLCVRGTSGGGEEKVCLPDTFGTCKDAVVSSLRCRIAVGRTCPRDWC